MVRLRNLFAVVMLSGIFSLSAAALYVVLDSVDVAFTEASVGAGIATVLMLGTLALTTTQEANPERGVAIGPADDLHRHRRGADLGHARHAAVRRSAGAGPTTTWCRSTWPIR